MTELTCWSDSVCGCSRWPRSGDVSAACRAMGVSSTYYRLSEGRRWGLEALRVRERRGADADEIGRPRAAGDRFCWHPVMGQALSAELPGQVGRYRLSEPASGACCGRAHRAQALALIAATDATSAAELAPPERHRRSEPARRSVRRSRRGGTRALWQYTRSTSLRYACQLGLRAQQSRHTASSFTAWRASSRRWLEAARSHETMMDSFGPVRQASRTRRRNAH